MKKIPNIQLAIIKYANSQNNLSVNDLRIIVVVERIVARLLASPRLENAIIFKGGFVLIKTTETTRFTRDLDATVLGIDKNEIPQIVIDAINNELNDGVFFGLLKFKEMEVGGHYGGFRFKVPYQFATRKPNDSNQEKWSKITIDIGIGDTVLQNLSSTIMTSVIELHEPVSWKIYPPEFIISEKLEALISRAGTSSRSKDIYDIGLLVGRCKNLENVKSAIKETFKQRGTKLTWPLIDLIAQLETSTLKDSWPSVKLRTTLSFDDAWNEFLQAISKIDAA